MSSMSPITPKRLYNLEKRSPPPAEGLFEFAETRSKKPLYKKPFLSSQGSISIPTLSNSNTGVSTMAPQPKATIGGVKAPPKLAKDELDPTIGRRTSFASLVADATGSVCIHPRKLTHSFRKVEALIPASLLVPRSEKMVLTKRRK